MSLHAPKSSESSSENSDMNVLVESAEVCLQRVISDLYRDVETTHAYLLALEMVVVGSSLPGFKRDWIGDAFFTLGGSSHDVVKTRQNRSPCGASRHRRDHKAMLTTCLFYFLFSIYHYRGYR